MVFRIPMAAYATYVGLVVAREDVVASVFTALVCAIAVTLGVALALLMFAFDAGDPVVRLPLIALATAAGMYASRALKIGPAAFLATYILVSSQTHIDRSMTAEVFVRVMIWLWVATMLPVAVMVVAQIATGARPGAIARRSALGLLAALADGLRNPQIGGLREHHAEAVELVASSHRAAKVNALSKRHVGDDARLVEILLTLLAMQDVLPTETPLALRARLADLCDACASAFERRDAAPPPAEPIAMDPTFGPAPPNVRAVVSAFAAALERLRNGLDLRNRGIAEHDPGARRPSLSSKRDRPENIRFALKATLAVMSAYLIYTALDWPGISTAVTTCFFVLLGSLGESMYKSTLRISGAP